MRSLPHPRVLRMGLSVARVQVPARPSFVTRSPQPLPASISTTRIINNLLPHHRIASIRSRLPCIVNPLARAREMIPQHPIIRNKRIPLTIILMIIICHIACIQVTFHHRLRFYSQDKHYQPLHPVTRHPNNRTMVADLNSLRLRTRDHLVFNTGRQDSRHFPTTPILRRTKISRIGDRAGRQLLGRLSWDHQ